MQVGNRGGPVVRWTFNANDAAGAAAVGPEVAVQLNEIQVVSIPADGCISRELFNAWILSSLWWTRQY